MIRMKSGSICQQCLKPVEFGAAVAICVVNVVSKPRVEFGISQSTVELVNSKSSPDQRSVYMPRYLIHVACLKILPVPTKEMLQEIEAKSRGKELE